MRAMDVALELALLEAKQLGPGEVQQSPQQNSELEVSDPAGRKD